MAGLLDWLTDGIGSQMGSSNAPMVSATNNYVSPGSAPLSPDEQPQATAAPRAAPPAPPAPLTAAVTPTPGPPAGPSTTDGTGAMQGGGAPPVPMPQPRPAGASVAPAAPVTPTAGAPLNITPPAPNPDSSPAAPPIKPASTSSFKFGDQTALGRSLGIDPNSNGFRSAMAGLGEGLTAAGNSKGKSAGQAFAAGAGGSLTGATKQDSTQYDQRLKALQLAVNAKQADNKAEYDKNYAKYLIGKNAADEAKTAAGGGKSGSWNKPDSQKFIDAQNAMAKDPDIRASQKILEAAVAGGNGPLNQPRINAAQAAHTALVQQKQKMYLAGVGLNPAQIQANIQNPPGTTQNPHIIVGDEKAAREQFDTYVKPGQAYKNPRDTPATLEPIRTSQSPIISWVRLAGQVNPGIQLFGRHYCCWWVSCIFTTKARIEG
jgi:hypothetical protein